MSAETCVRTSVLEVVGESRTARYYSMFRPSFESQFERSGYNIISYTMTFSVVERGSALCILIEVRPLDKWPWKPTHQVELKSSSN